MSIQVLTKDLLSDLEKRASNSGRRRQHHNIHRSFDAPCQRLLNAISTDSYIRPHCHSIDPKDEFLIAIKGRFGLIVFSEQGDVIRKEVFGSESFFSSGEVGAFAVEVPSGTWHTIVALESYSVLLEVKDGPFNPDAAKEFPFWAPEDGTEAAESYFNYLKSLFLQ